MRNAGKNAKRNTVLEKTIGADCSCPINRFSVIDDITLHLRPEVDILQTASVLGSCWLRIICLSIQLPK